MGNGTKSLRTRLMVAIAGLAIALIVAPSTALAAPAQHVVVNNGGGNINLSIGDSANIGGGKMSFYGSGGDAPTLHIENVDVTGSVYLPDAGKNCAMYIDGDIVIEIKGKSTFTGVGNSGAKGEYGIWIDGTAWIHNTSSDYSDELIAVGASPTSDIKDSESFGLYVQDDLTISCCNVEGYGSKCGMRAAMSAGIAVEGILDTNNSYVYGEGASCTNSAVSGVAYSIGIYCRDGIDVYRAKVDGYSGMVNAGSEAYSIGIMLPNAGGTNRFGPNAQVQGFANGEVYCSNGDARAFGICSFGDIVTEADDLGSYPLFIAEVSEKVSSTSGDATSAGLAIVPKEGTDFTPTLVVKKGTSVQALSHNSNYAADNYGILGYVEFDGANLAAGASAGRAMSEVPGFGASKFKYVVKTYSAIDPDTQTGQYDARTIGIQHPETYLGNPLVIIEDSGERNVKRIWGQWAADTAAAISEWSFHKSDWVIVARDDDFADAMSASGLAGALECPIILTNYDKLVDSARNEIARTGATHAYVIGGPYAMEEPVVQALEGMGLSVERVYGTACYDTSVECAKKIQQIVGEETFAYTPAIVAQSCNFQDALSISPLAYRYGIPIYLEKNYGDYALPDEAIDMISEQQSMIFVPGGPYAVGPETVEEVFGTLRVQRIYGTTGYDTSNELAKYFVNGGMLDSDVICIANGAFSLGGSDALAGAALAGKAGCPLILASPQIYFEAINYACIDAYGEDSFLYEYGPGADVIYLLGGEFVLPPDFEDVVISTAHIPMG